MGRATRRHCHSAERWNVSGSWKGGDPARCAIRALSCDGGVLLSGCGPKIEDQSPDGVPQMDLNRGVCFVGCDVATRLPDGANCCGFAVRMQYGRLMAADTYCPDAPTAEQNDPSTGDLTPYASFFWDEPIGVEAIVAAHVPTPEP
ncbi:MAG: hypothetical protein AAFP16_07935 [Pseudomonadota bacterium]